MSPAKPTNERSDADIIAVVTGGDKNAFREIVRRYEGTVAKTVIGMLGPCDDAEDVGQQAMIKVYRGLSSFKGDSAFKTYVTRIAMNTALDELRRRDRARRRFSFFSHHEEVNPMDGLTDPRDEMAGADAGQVVEKALSKLSPEFRAVVVLRLVEGYDAVEVAELLQISEGTVHSRLSRARKQLIKFMGPG
jgi:RNA polymerase sigma-70 factor (ECF subfamily)